MSRKRNNRNRPRGFWILELSDTGLNITMPTMLKETKDKSENFNSKILKYEGQRRCFYVDSIFHIISQSKF